MTLLQRAPREVYRVYTEDEFFAAAGSEALEDGDERAADSPVGESRLRRLAGVTALLAIAGAVGGVTALSDATSSSGARRRVRRDLLAAAPRAVSRSASVPALRAPADGVHAVNSSARGARHARPAAVQRAEMEHAAGEDASTVHSAGPSAAPFAADTEGSPGSANPTVVAAVPSDVRERPQEFGFER
jgi:hypothetical protein